MADGDGKPSTVSCLSIFPQRHVYHRADSSQVGDKKIMQEPYPRVATGFSELAATAGPPDLQCSSIPAPLIHAVRLLHIYNHNNQLDLINELLKDVDFHPLSVTLLAMVV